MSDYRMCPLMRGGYDDMLVFRNVEPSEELIKELSERKTIGLYICDGGATTIEPITGICKENTCAWWDELKQCCAVLTIARAARQKGG